MSDDEASSTAMHSVRASLPPISTGTAQVMVAPIVDLPPAHAESVGQIAAKWTWLENQLGVLIREGFSLDKKEGRVLVGTMKLGVKVTILKIMALKWEQNVKFRDELRKFANDCLKQTDPRNDHVHGIWSHPAGEPNNIGLLVIDSGEQKYRPDFKPVPLSDLQKIVSDLKELQTRGQNLTDKIKGRLPKS